MIFFRRPLNCGTVYHGECKKYSHLNFIKTLLLIHENILFLILVPVRVYVKYYIQDSVWRTFIKRQTVVKNIIENPNCSIESPIHFLLNCHKYDDLRDKYLFSIQIPLVLNTENFTC